MSPVVVALGAVDPALVEPYLPEGARFVAEPGPEDLTAAYGAIVRADGEPHRAPRPAELIGDLYAGRPRANHQHTAFRELLRLEIVRGMNLLHSAILRRDGRYHRALERPGGGDNTLRLNHAQRGFHAKPRTAV